MKVGIIGLPNVGKSTLFKALTKHPVDINNYPFCTIEPNVGVVEVPDTRLYDLAKMSKSDKTVPAVVEFVDIAGLVKGASEGEGLGNKFLANIREVDAIVHVVRVFQNSNIVHTSGSVHPERDIDIVHTELILADLESLEKRVSKMQKETRSGDKTAKVKSAMLEIFSKALSQGKFASEVIWDKSNEILRDYYKELQLLTAKPIVFAYNISDFDTPLPNTLEKRDHVKLDIKIEEDLLEMSREDMRELGLETNMQALIRKAYEMLDLITFFTTGQTETRAWTIKRGSTAPVSGMAIHNDFKDKFIRAEVIGCEELLKCGSWAAAREKGKLRLEGKEYIVKDGDTIIFKI